MRSGKKGKKKVSFREGGENCLLSERKGKQKAEVYGSIPLSVSKKEEKKRK